MRVGPFWVYLITITFLFKLCKIVLINIRIKVIAIKQPTLPHASFSNVLILGQHDGGSLRCHLSKTLFH